MIDKNIYNEESQGFLLKIISTLGNLMFGTVIRKPQLVFEKILVTGIRLFLEYLLLKCKILL